MNTLPGYRPSTDEYFSSMAMLVAARGTCGRRKVGCVLVDRYNHVLSTGYNGTHSGAAHCIDIPCPGRNQPSGQGLNLCEAIHAEQNALLQCADVHRIYTVYCTASPCIQCMRLLANTSVDRIVFIEEYPHYESREIAERQGIQWIHFDGANR